MNSLGKEASPPAGPVASGSGVELIRAERERQTAEEGWSAEHDDGHVDGELAAAAAAYAYPGTLRTRDHRAVHKRLLWPWEDGWRDHFQPEHLRHPRVGRLRELVKAGALIAAEIDRLQRAPSPTGPESEAPVQEGKSS